jgi:hypothetical protein
LPIHHDPICPRTVFQGAMSQFEETIIKTIIGVH